MELIPIFLTAFALYLRTAAPTITAGDTPELFLACFNLDVTHPPGYALLALLGRLAFDIPAGGLMFRASLLSAAAGAGTVALAFSCVRALGGSRAAAGLSALLLALQPLLWWQSTMLEKYALQMLLAALALRVMLSPPPVAAPATALSKRHPSPDANAPQKPDASKRAEGLIPAFACAIALAHHSLAVFLVPLLFLRFLPVWRGGPARACRMTAVALGLGLMPLSLRAVFPAVRAAAMHTAETAPLPGEKREAIKPMRVNWGEPYNFRALVDYLRLKYYSVRFTKVNLSRATTREHLSFLPRHLSWPGLAAGAAGLVLLLFRSPALGAALAGILVLSFAFNLRFVLPPSLADVYHQDEFLVLAVCAGIAAGELRRLLSPWRRTWPAASLAAAAGLLAWGLPRFPVYDAGRHFFIYDYLNSSLKIAPRGAVFMAGFDSDRFAAGYFQQALGRRTDLVPLPVPHKVMKGHFAVRRKYRPWAAALLPRAVLRFDDEDNGFDILRRLVEDNRNSTCFAMSPLSEPAVPRDLFTLDGPLYLSNRGACAPKPSAGRTFRLWRAVPSRAWFLPSRIIAYHRTLLDAVANDLGYAAESIKAADPGSAERLMKERIRLMPNQPQAWYSFAMFHWSRGRTSDAAAELRRAIELDPGAPENLLAFLDLIMRLGAPGQAAAFLHEVLTHNPVARASAAPGALRELDSGRLPGAALAARRAFAETALRQAETIPGNPEFVMRKLFLYRFAAENAPEWREAQEKCGNILLVTADYAGAAHYLARAWKLSPEDPSGGFHLAVALLMAGRLDETVALLERVARMAPAEPGVWFYLGQAELSRERRREAADAFSHFLRLAPAAPQAPMVRRVLASLSTAR